MPSRSCASSAAPVLFHWQMKGIKRDEVKGKGGGSKAETSNVDYFLGRIIRNWHL